MVLAALTGSLVSIMVNMKVRYAVACARCGKVIGIGARAVRPYGKPLWHASCYGKYASERGIPMERKIKVR